MAETKVSMKLLVNCQTNKVLFAEAGKDCVDFLFYIMSLPIAKVITLLREQGMVGCLGNLYESMETLNDTYIQTGRSKSSLLKEMASPPSFGAPASVIPLLCIGDTPSNQKSYYRCSYCGVRADSKREFCNCGHRINLSWPYFEGPSVEGKDSAGEGGFVKGVVTYMVMDDLVVKPMSIISSLTLLNKYNVTDVASLKEKVVNLGKEEAVKLLKASLHSKKVLTEVFLN